MHPSTHRPVFLARSIVQTVLLCMIQFSSFSPLLPPNTHPKKDKLSLTCFSIFYSIIMFGIFAKSKKRNFMCYKNRYCNYKFPFMKTCFCMLFIFAKLHHNSKSMLHRSMSGHLLLKPQEEPTGQYLC